MKKIMLALTMLLFVGTAQSVAAEESIHTKVKEQTIEQENVSQSPENIKDQNLEVREEVSEKNLNVEEDSLNEDLEKIEAFKKETSEKFLRKSDEISQEIKSLPWVDTTLVEQEMASIDDSLRDSLNELDTIEDVKKSESEHHDQQAQLKQSYIQSSQETLTKLVENRIDEVKAIKEKDHALYESMEHFNLEAIDEKYQKELEELEAVLRSAKNEEAMDEAKESFLDNWETYRNEVLLQEAQSMAEEILGEDYKEIIDEMISWGLLHEEDIKQEIQNILENYDDYLEAGKVLKELFEMRLENMKRMRLLYQQQKDAQSVLPATGVFSQRSYQGIALVLCGFYLVLKERYAS